MDFKIEITGKQEGEYFHVNVNDIFEGDKSNGLRFILAYKELVNYIHMYMPNMSKEAMIGIVEEIFK